MEKLYHFFWCIGFFYTATQIHNSVTEYNKFKSAIVQRSATLDDDNFFPFILICADWLHSRDKLEIFYPNITQNDIEYLYGLGLSTDAEQAWLYKYLRPEKLKKLRDDIPDHMQELNKVNLTKFTYKTFPSYFLFNCQERLLIGQKVK